MDSSEYKEKLMEEALERLYKAEAEAALREPGLTEEKIREREIAKDAAVMEVAKLIGPIPAVALYGSPWWRGETEPEDSFGDEIQQKIKDVEE